ncbi:MAG: TIR domain-containing protein [Clostridia bacterium]|nr:TIR domain-containing protein [Clostridia bacterium]
MNQSNPGVFISHHSKSTISLVIELSNVLQAYDIDHWYAERDIRPMDNYTEVIPLVIEECKLFLLLLNKESNVSKQVLREVQCALRQTKNPIPVMIARLDDCEESQSIAYIGSTVQYVDLRGLNKVVAAQKLGEAINAWKNGHSTIVQEKNVFQIERAETALDFYGDEGERKRLASQRQFVYDFAAEEYDSFISELHNGSFLDIGCNTGEQAMMFVEGRSEIQHYIGIDRESLALDKAREFFPSGHFYQGNCEADDFDQLLCKIEEELDIDGFDLINLSMVLLHMKEPQFVLDTLAGHLTDGGRIVILDIDDGLNIAYPDPDEWFSKAVEICSETGYSGYRKSGRQVCQLLTDIEMHEIQLHKQGLSTAGMTRDKRSAFYELYFWFILDDLRKMNQQAPENKIVLAELNWFEEHYKEMKARFKKKSFYFNLGFMLYSAT